jgi:hypothetical protein
LNYPPFVGFTARQEKRAGGMKVDGSYGSAGWCLPPPVAGDWRDLSQEDAALLARRLGEAVTESDPAWESFRVEAVRLLKLDFYPGWLLCDVQTAPQKILPFLRPDPFGASDGPVRCIHSGLYGPDGFTPLDGKARGILGHNMLHHLEIGTDAQRISYLRFFCFFVRGEEGPFEIHEDAACLATAGPDAQEARARLASIVRPIRPHGSPSDEHFEYDASVHYGGNLFDARFRIHASGSIEMVHDDPRAEGVHRAPAIGFSGMIRFPLTAPPAAGEECP